MATSWVPGAHNFLPMDQGWDGWVKSPNIAPDEDGEPRHQANGKLSFTDADGTEQMIGLWINDIQFTFGMAGSQVQSKTRRSFFPHNFVAPVTQFTGQCSNQYEYNRLSQFVRQAQLNLMRGVSLSPHGEGLRLTVLDRTPDNDLDYKQRGRHGGFDAYGYILNAPAGAERWVNAPTYTFEFTITDVKGGFFDNVLKDSTEQRRKMESITDLFLSHPASPDGFVTGKRVRQIQKNNTQRDHTEHKGHGLPPQDINNPVLNPGVQPIQIVGPNGVIPIISPSEDTTGQTPGQN